MGAVRNPYLAINQGLVGDWGMPEGAGNTVADLSGNGCHGIITGTVPWIAGKGGPALQFPNTAGNYVSTSASSVFNNTAGSIVLWMKTTEAATYEGLVNIYINANNQAYVDIFHGDDDIHVTVKSEGGDRGTFTDDVPVDDNIWHQVVLTFGSGQTTKIYRDGIFKAEGGNSGTIAWVGNPTVYIGTDAPNTYPCPAAIDSVLIYNRALSASEIQQLYREPFCMFDRDPIELWTGAMGGGVPPVGNAGIMTCNAGYWGT